MEFMPHWISFQMKWLHWSYGTYRTQLRKGSFFVTKITELHKLWLKQPGYEKVFNNSAAEFNFLESLFKLEVKLRRPLWLKTPSKQKKNMALRWKSFRYFLIWILRWVHQMEIGWKNSLLWFKHMRQFIFQWSSYLKQAQKARAC